MFGLFCSRKAKKEEGEEERNKKPRRYSFVVIENGQRNEKDITKRNDIIFITQNRSTRLCIIIVSSRGYAWLLLFSFEKVAEAIYVCSLGLGRENHIIYILPTPIILACPLPLWPTVLFPTKSSPNTTSEQTFPIHLPFNQNGPIIRPCLNTSTNLTSPWVVAVAQEP